MSEQIVIPDIGTEDAVDVIELSVSAGQEVTPDQTLMVLESDKASMEIPSPYHAVISEVLIKEGDQVTTGQAAFVVTFCESESEAASQNPSVSGSNDTPDMASVAQAVSPVNESRSSESDSMSNKTTQSIGVRVPDIDTREAVELIEVCVSVGDEIDKDDALVVLESDKASMEIPSPHAGTVLSIEVQQGQQLKQDDLILHLQGIGEQSASEAPAQMPNSASDKGESQVSLDADCPEVQIQHINTTGVIQNRPSLSVYAGPAVRLMARELGVDLAEVPGSGPNQRVLKDDIQQYVKRLVQRSASYVESSAIPSVPEVDFSEFGDIKVEAMSKLAKLTALNMQRSWLNVPHVTQFDLLDITDLETFRREQADESQKRDVKLTSLAFVFKALAIALKEHPKFNTSLSLDGESLIYKQYVHIGMAVDTDYGLVVPVIRDVDQKNIWELADDIARAAHDARERKLRPNDMKGGCFTVSSLGRIGGTGFTPIINTPEVGILGLSNMDVKPVWNAEEACFEPHKVLPVALSYDHRVINGGDAGRFLVFFKSLIADLRQLALIG
ncbi:MAG: dihydrolipoyllysine-residue acetyltransferase [Pseudomonadota bacterium]